MTSTKEITRVFHDTYCKVKKLGGIQESRIFMLWAYLTMYKYQKASDRKWLKVEPLQSLDKEELVFIVRIKK